MQAAITIAVKDLKQRLRDRSAYLVGIIAPLALAAIFSFVFNPIAEFEFSASYAVVDEDGGAAARLFIDQVLGGFAQDGDVDVTEVGNRAEATALVDVEFDPFADVERTDAAFVIPAGFSAAVASENSTAIEVIAGRGSETASAIAVSIAERFTSELETARVATATVEFFGAEGDRFDTGLRSLTVANPASLVESPATSRILSGTTFYAAGLAVFFLFFTIQFGVNSLLEERHAGTLSRLLVAPIPKMAVIAGKALTAFVLGFVSMVVLAIATTVLFGADWGHPVGVILLILAGIFSAIGLMAVIAGFAKTAEQAAVFSSIVALVLGFLGGTFFPVSQAGGVLSRLRFVTPHAWFMQGLGDLAGGELTAVIPAVVALLIIGVATSLLAMVGLRRGLQP